MIIPLRTDSPLRTTPYINWVLIAANVAVFIATLSDPRAADGFGLSPRQPQLFQFFTYQFLHSGWLHIAGNMLFLYIFGNNVNDRLGNVGYLALYLAGGVFAGISYVVTSSGNAVQMVGASGSIAAVTGAFLVLLPRSNVTVIYFWFLVGVTEIASMWLILLFFALDIYENIIARDSVAHMAHVGGTIFGALTCMVLLALQLLPRDPFDVVAMIQRWNRRRQYRDLVAGGYNPFEYEPAARAARLGGPPAPPPPDPRTARLLEARAAISDALLAHDLDLAARLYLDLRGIDPQQTLPRQQQLDVANHLAAQQLHAQAAEAYEAFLRQYPKSDQVAQVELMLGLIYARYLNHPDRAREYLTQAASKYHSGRELDLARDELSRLKSSPQPPTR